MGGVTQYPGVSAGPGVSLGSGVGGAGVGGVSQDSGEYGFLITEDGNYIVSELNIFIIEEQYVTFNILAENGSFLVDEFGNYLVINDPITQIILPNDPKLFISDYYTILEQSSSALKFDRVPAIGIRSRETPGCRVGFYTDAEDVVFNVYWEALAHTSGKNSGGNILVDGVLSQTFFNPYGNIGSGADVLYCSGQGYRKIELVWPYGFPMNLVGIALTDNAKLVSASRPASSIYFLGDSITQGFHASSMAYEWVYLLASMRNTQIINMGYGARTTVASDATYIAGTNPDIVILFIGTNDVSAGTPLATVQTQMEGLIANARTAAPTAKLVVITELYYIPNDSIVEPYRQVIRDAVAAVGDSNLQLIEGPSLCSHTVSALADYIHPTDFGHSEIANNLNTQIV